MDDKLKMVPVTLHRIYKCAMKRHYDNVVWWYCRKSVCFLGTPRVLRHSLFDNICDKFVEIEDGARKS